MTTKINMLAIDLAKGSFQVCAVGPEGTVLYNRGLSRTRLAALLAEQTACIVAMEACATSHHWGRVAQRYGHEVRLVPAAHVKPFVNADCNFPRSAEVKVPTLRCPVVSRFRDWRLRSWVAGRAFWAAAAARWVRWRAHAPG